MLKRIFALFMCVAMVFTMLPLEVFAQAGCDHHSSHTNTCGYREAVEGVPCGHVCGEACPTQEVTACVHDHTASGCTYTEPQEGVEGGWSCGHVCGRESGCIKDICSHVCPGDSCGFVAAQGAAPCGYVCGICQVQALVDALPTEVTAENLESVGQQLTAIDQARKKLTDAEMAQVDFTRYQNAIAAINTLNGQPGAEVPETVASGTHGTNLSWSFDEATGTLTVTGKGEMKSVAKTDYPWYAYRKQTKAIVIGEGITTIAQYAFSTYTDDTQMTTLSLPSTLKSIGYDAFYNSSELTSVTFPQGLETIGGYAFGQCHSLKSLVIPDSVTTIGNNAFVDCEYLSTVSVGKGLKNLEGNVFCVLPYLSSLTVDPANPYFVTVDSVLYTKDMTELVTYPGNKSSGTYTVPASVTKIRDYAFNQASGISKLIFEGNAPTIGANSFRKCYFEIHYDSTKSGWSSVVNKTYGYNCNVRWVDSTSNVVTGKMTDTITWSLNLTTGAFTATGTGDMAFYDHLEGETPPWNAYKSQIKSVTIGSGITSVGGSNFSMCTNLTSVSLPETVTSILRSAFSGCSSLASVTLPSKLTTIGPSAFSGCSALTAITIPKSVTTIYENAFSSTGLVSVTLPDSVTTVGNKAFAFCNNLTDVTFGSGVRSLGGSIFQQCKALKTITFTGSLPSAPDNDICVQTSGVTAIYPASWGNADKSDISTSVTWKVDCEHTGQVSYKDNMDGKTHAKTCTSCGTVLAQEENHSFSNGKCTCGAYQCGDNAFASLSDTGVLTVYGTGAMYDYSVEGPWYPRTGITSVVIQPGITYIGKYAFAKCTKITSVTIPNTVTGVGDRAFSGSTKLPTVTVPSSVKAMGSGVFEDCTALTSVTLPGEVTSFGWSMFQNCTSLTSVALPKGVAGVPEYTFRGCTALTSVTIPEGYTFIQLAAFYGTGVTSIKLPNSMEKIYEAAFQNCAGLKEVTIPEAVTYLGSCAFDSTGLTKITFLGTPETLGTNLFGSVKADVYYFENGKWTSSNKLQYGGTLNWIGMDPCAQGHTYRYVNRYDGATHYKSCEKCALATVTENHTVSGGVCPCGYATSGKCGDNVYWSYNTTTGALTITGTGAMYDYWNRYDYFDDEPEDSWNADATPPWRGLTLSSVSVGSGVTNIGNYAFYRMSVGTVTMADSVTKIGMYALYGTSATVTASANITAVGECGLTGTTVDRIAKMVTVGKGAFMRTKFVDGKVAVTGWVDEWSFYDSGVTTLILGENVTYIRSYALGGCDKLTEIYYCGNKPNTNNDSFFPYVTGVTRTAYRTPNATGFSSSTKIWEDKDHATVKGTPVAPTCTESGYTPYTCPYCSIVVKMDEVAAKGHSYTYTANNNAKTITVGCGSCDLKVVFTLKAPISLDYTGDPIEATVTGEGENMNPTVTYTGPTTNGKPVAPGTYTAKLTMGGAQVSVSYTVTGNVASIDFINEKLVGLRPNTAYTIGQWDHVTDNDGALTIYEEWMGTELTIHDAYGSGATQTLSIPTRPGYPTGITIVRESRAGQNDGKLVGVTSAMEYRQDTPVMADSWTKVTATTITGLAPGSYGVRYAATATSFAGQTMGYVIPEGMKSITADDFGVSIPSGMAYNGIGRQVSLSLPQDLVPHAVFVRYYDAQGNLLSGLPVDVGEYTFQLEVANSLVYESNAAITHEAWKLAIVPWQVSFVSAYVPDQTYSGDYLTPQVTLDFGNLPDGCVPEPDKDYTITYEDNLNVGTATVKVTALEGGNYSFAEVRTSFRIQPRHGNMTFAMEAGTFEYTGNAVEPFVSAQLDWGLEAVELIRDRDYTVTYKDNVKIGTGSFTISPVEGSNYTFTPQTAYFEIVPVQSGVEIGNIPIQTYNGKPQEPKLQLNFVGIPGTMKPVEGKDYTVTFANNVNAGTASVTVSQVKGGNLEFESVTREFTIDPCRIQVSIEPIRKQVYTGEEVVPYFELTSTGVPKGQTLVRGKDYVVSVFDNVEVGNRAYVKVNPAVGGNYVFETAAQTFEIAKAVEIPADETFYIDGEYIPVEDGFLWLGDRQPSFLTTYSQANAGSDDIHSVYPTGMRVWAMEYDENGRCTLKEVTELENILQYSGTSIRITGNQGIRFITSIPKAKRAALTGSGLAGYKLVEYGTLMGWYSPGTELLYGTNAKSVAYDRAAGVDAVFNTTGDLVQFTGMLTDLDLEQSTRDLMTRPYMVLEKTDAEGNTRQMVLYGGSIVRSIGYVAYQNKDVFKPGTSSYEFIWKILSYAYPDLYEAEYKG